MFHAHGAGPAVSPALRLAGESNRPAERCTASCGAPRSLAVPSSATGKATTGTASVCDRSCYAGSGGENGENGENSARFGGHLCGAGDAAEFGEHCRTCFDDLEEARAAEERLAEEERLALGQRGNKKKDKTKNGAVEELLNGEDVGVGVGGGGGGGGSTSSKRRRTLRAGGVGRTERREGGGEWGREDEFVEEEGSGLVGGGAARGEVGGEGGDDDDDGHVGGGGGGGEMDGRDGEEMIEQRRHVIMCDTLMPPPPAAVADCSLKCQRKTDTVRSGGRHRPASELLANTHENTHEIPHLHALKILHRRTQSVSHTFVHDSQALSVFVAMFFPRTGFFIHYYPIIVLETANLSIYTPSRTPLAIARVRCSPSVIVDFTFGCPDWSASPIKFPSSIFC